MTVTKQSHMPPSMPAGYAAPRPAPAPRPLPQAVPMPASQMAPPAPHMAPPAPHMAPPAPQMAPQMAPHMVPPTMPYAAAPPAAQPAMPQPGYYPNMAHRMPAAAPIAQAMPVMEERREDGDKMLPAISVHVFCERKETGSVMTTATHDWRMSRTNVDIFMGGLNAAIDYYHNENTPNLIMIETGMTGQELFTQLEQLASVCDEGTRVVVIGAANDIRLYRQLMEKGVSDYLVPPFHPMTIIRSISDLYLSEDAPFMGRAVAIYGAKGGVGSSTISHNLAWILAEHMGYETALIDLDETWGTTGIDFAYDTAQGLEEALSQADRLDEALLDKIMVRHTKKLSILPTAASLGNGKAFDSPETFEKVINGVRAISPFSLFDMPHVWADWSSATLTGADEIVIVATPDLACLRNAKNLVDFLKAKRPNDPDPLVVINQVGRSKHEIPLKDFSAAIGIEVAVSLAFDPDTFTEAANDGKMLTELKAASAHVAGLNYLATRVRTGKFPIMTPNKKGRKSKSREKGNDQGSSVIGSVLSKLKKK